MLERKENRLLIYDGRADWWILGVSLYGITTEWYSISYSIVNRDITNALGNPNPIAKGYLIHPGKS